MVYTVGGISAFIGTKGGRFLIKNDLILPVKNGHGFIEIMRAGPLSGREEDGRRTRHGSGYGNLF